MRETHLTAVKKPIPPARRRSRTLCVTGKLAAPALRDTVGALSPSVAYGIAVLPISVAALMDARYVNRHLPNADGFDRVLLPGLCRGELQPLADRLGVDVVRGPADLKDLPEYFGARRPRKAYGAYRTQIVAEIVDAHALSLEAILDRAAYFREEGADIIDLGGPVQGAFPEIGRTVRKLRARGFRVSVDSFHPEDILAADAAGAEFILSVNARNIDLAPRLRCKVVVIPDFEKGTRTLDRNIARLEKAGARYIVDPVLNPIGFGFARSLSDFIAVRRKYPRAEMLMGLGNLTELTGADSTGITAVLAGIVEELGIDYVLTTEVAAWARGAVRELDIARRLMHHACANRILPRHLDDGLITVKDPPYNAYSEEELRAMQARVRDRNFRIFAGRGQVYVFNNRCFIVDTDIQRIFDRLGVMSPSQAFYLGKELQKASLAARLGKKFVQEQDLHWGYLNQPPVFGGGRRRKSGTGREPAGAQIRTPKRTP